MEAATNELLETGKKVGADFSWQQRVQESDAALRLRRSRHLLPHLLHGAPAASRPRRRAASAAATCTAASSAATICASPLAAPAAHSDHGRQICHTLYQAKEGGSYQVKDPEKLKKIAAEWGIETEGKDIYDLAHEVAEERVLLEYGKPFGVQRYLKRAPEHTQKLWHETPASSRARSTVRSRSRCT